MLHPAVLPFLALDSRPSPCRLPLCLSKPQAGSPFLRFNVVWFEGEGSPRGSASGRDLLDVFVVGVAALAFSYRSVWQRARKGRSHFSFEQDTGHLACERAIGHRPPRA